MSYLVLARKWRPQGFEDLIGQEPLGRILKNAIDQGRIAHAYLFSGPRGVGKTSTARILAKALNCQSGPTSSPCGSCAFCTGITEGSSVDVMEIDGASNNSVNDIRDLRERVKYAPSGGRYKIYIIDETHMLSDAAFNALLKTLEEPPPHVIFVLATTAPQKIPATVLSRCQHLPFRRIPGPLMKERLKKISSEEKISITGPALDMIVRAADGSLRDALTILDQISSFSSDIGEEEVKDLLGITDFALLSRLAESLVDGDREDILTMTTELAERGTDIRSFMRELIQFFRDLLVMSIVKKPEDILDVPAEERVVMQNILRKTTEDHLTLLVSELLKAELDVRNATSPRLALEMSLLKASFLAEIRPIKEVLDELDHYRMDRPVRQREVADDLPPLRAEGFSAGELREPIQPVLPEKGEERAPAFSQSGRESAILPPQPTLLTDEVKERALNKMSPPLQSKLATASFQLRDDKLIVTLDGGGAVVFTDSINQHRQLIEEVFSGELGRVVTVEVQTAKKKVLRRKDLKEEVMADSTIREVLDLFDGRIVDVTPIKNKRDTLRNGGTHVEKDAR